MTLKTIHEEFNNLPISIRNYMLQRDLDPYPISNMRLIEFLHGSLTIYSSTYSRFRKDLIEMCGGDKQLEKELWII